MIAYDKNTGLTVDSETGDYLKIIQYHHTIPYTTYGLFGKDGNALLVAELEYDGVMGNTPAGEALFQKWTLTKAFIPNKIYPPPSTSYEVPSYLINSLSQFLKGRLETEFTRTPPPI